MISNYRLGILYALLSYMLWGFVPFYWKQLQGIALGQVLAHRIFWSMITVLILIFVTRKFKDFQQAIQTREKLFSLLLSAFFIGTSWSIYIFSIYRHELVQASLGYFINPLISVALGIIFLKERLNRLQILAVILATIGVLTLGLHHQGFPWIALSLAFSFAFYGLIKKRIGVDSLVGLGVETLWISPIAIAYLLLWHRADLYHTFTHELLTSFLLIGTGLLTLAPLFFFNGAAKRLPLSTLGFFQYLSPSIQLILAVFYFHEPFTKLQGISFGFIWLALVLFTLANWTSGGISLRFKPQ